MSEFTRKFRAIGVDAADKLTKETHVDVEYVVQFPPADATEEERKAFLSAEGYIPFLQDGVQTGRAYLHSFKYRDAPQGPPTAEIKITPAP